ncbi:MAG: DEAD/DEAH box helicase [Syntrophales bacterium]|nr:DEAD/DEAH box helicase [Syntrophales bacterium]
MNFEQFSLDPHLLSAIRAEGYTSPTPIQEKAMPPVLAGRDVLGLAQTGTGKTAAFVLPILQRLIAEQCLVERARPTHERDKAPGTKRHIRALIVAPTRELAEQIHQATISLGRNTSVKSATIYGGVSKGPQLITLRRGVDIVIACPGRLLDHLGEGNIDLGHVEVLVLDEADRMCDMGFLPDIKRIIRSLPAKRQTLFFSATMPDDIRSLADGILSNPISVQIGMIAPAKTVTHALYPAPDGRKTDLLLAMLQQTPTGRVLIFTRTKHRARNLASSLEKSNYRVSALQGNMTQNRRQDAINGFKGGKYDILVATDIAARGIDVSEISHVINFDMPDTVDAYTHRIGRTGRALQTGEAFTFSSPADEIIIRQIEQVLGARIERRRLPDFDYGNQVQESAFISTRPQQPRPQVRRLNTGAARPAQGQAAPRTRPAYVAQRRGGDPAGARTSRSQTTPQRRKALPSSAAVRRAW